SRGWGGTGAGTARSHGPRGPPGRNLRRRSRCRKRGPRPWRRARDRSRMRPTMSEPTLPAKRLLAVHLPQFHPIPENDSWWGPGFTEWRNVAKARPRFPGHQQPHLPSDLGFYDLRLPEARAAQAELARAHGLSAFLY